MGQNRERDGRVRSGGCHRRRGMAAVSGTRSGQMDSSECKEGDGCLWGWSGPCVEEKSKREELGGVFGDPRSIHDRVQEKGRCWGGGPADL
jgi:hypothetical protein